MNHPLAPLIQRLNQQSVRYLFIGAAGANLYALRAGMTFATADFDLFLPLDPDNLQTAWRCCEAAGLELWLHDEPLDQPRDHWLAERFVEQRIATVVTGPTLQADLTLVMKGFTFEQVWDERREFEVDEIAVPTARLVHIIQSKVAAGREKDRLFLATHRDALEQLLKKTELD